MPEKHVNQATKIVFLAGEEKAVYAAEDTQAMRRVVMDNLLRKSMKPYVKVQVATKRRSDGTAEAMVAYMLRAHTYTVDVAKVKVGANYAVKGVELDYAVGQDDWAYPTIHPPMIVPKKPPKGLKKVQMVFGTPVPEIATAKAAVEYLYKMATALGYRCVKLLGASASVANYKKYLSGHLLAFVNVGHGNTSGIALADGFLPSGWFAGLPAKAVWPEVVYFNSCQTFNDPLLAAVAKAGARTYVAGKVNLLIGASEEVCKCFWTKALRGGEKMGTALTACEKAKYPNPGSHGIAGFKGKFKLTPPFPPLP